MKRKFGWERSPGWVLSGIGTLVLVAGWFLLLTFVVGVPLVALSDLVGRIR